MVSPTPHQSNPHVACRTYGDRRSPRTRAATVRDDPEPDGVASISESSDTLQPDSRDRRIVTAGTSTLPTFTDPRNPLRLPKYKRRI